MIKQVAVINYRFHINFNQQFFSSSRMMEIRSWDLPTLHQPHSYLQISKFHSTSVKPKNLTRCLSRKNFFFSSKNIDLKFE